MTNTLRVDLDIAYDYYDTFEFRTDLAKHNLAHELIELEGPGGGNPYIWLIGPRANVEALLTEWQYDADDIEYLIDGE